MYKYINVLITNFKQDDRLFTYKVKEELFSNIKIGMRVIVPFGKKNNEKEGFVINEVTNISIDESEIKEIISIPDDFSLVNDEMLLLARFMSEKYCAALSDSINVIMPTATRRLERKENTIKMVKLNDKFNDEEYFNNYIDELEKSKAEHKKKQLSLVIYLKELLKKKIDVELEDISVKFNYSTSSIKTLVKNEIIDVYEKVIKEEKNENQIINEDIILTDEQDKIYNEILNTKDNEILLKGITGSGKTEIYIKLVENAINEGKTGIILVPEIGLTGQMVNRFKSRFTNVSIMHSKMSPTERYEEWKKVKEGLIDVVIGPRSAIFMPIENIGIIVIDEEHEMTYKSEQTPKYDTVDVARFRAKYYGAKLLLASATPNIETYLRAKEGKIKLFELKERYNKKPLPKIEIIDMKEELEKGNKSIFSITLAKEIKKRLDNKEQVILFLNRRGFSTFVSCRKCGHVMKCPECEIPYVYHKTFETLECHYCFRKEKNVHICPSCGSKYIKHFGTGTEKVEQEIKRIFPKAKVARMDADTTTRKGSQDIILNDFKNGNTDILIGTQMIAKGHNFPNVTLVCVLAADMMLNYQDFRAAERTFQLITQVAGRAGRGEKEGEVILQTYTPDNYAIVCAASYDYESFYNKEIVLRNLLKYPPYSSLFYIVFSGENLGEVKKEINKLKSLIDYDIKGINDTNKGNQIKVLGPGEASIGKLKNMYRWQILLKCDNEEYLKSFAMTMLKKYRSLNNNKILIQINFD